MSPYNTQSYTHEDHVSLVVIVIQYTCTLLINYLYFNIVINIVYTSIWLFLLIMDKIIKKSLEI